MVMSLQFLKVNDNDDCLNELKDDSLPDLGEKSVKFLEYLEKTLTKETATFLRTIWNLLIFFFFFLKDHLCSLQLRDL